jgi:intracellular sulfur oxidation DsrE/DsrF family protein
MSKTLRMLLVICTLAVPALIAAGVSAQDVRSHRLVIQVSSDVPETMTVALGNAMNAKRYYDAKGESLTVEIVTYGPGITMLRSDTSPVKERISEAKASIPNLTLSMCANSKAGAERREGKTIVPIEGVQVVPAGIVRVMELQEQGYSYARP